MTEDSICFFAGEDLIYKAKLTEKNALIIMKLRIMKFLIKGLILFILCTIFLFAQNKESETQINESIVKILDHENCESVEDEKIRGIDFTIMCEGVGGYKLKYSSGLLYDYLNLITPKGKTIELDVWAKIKDPSHLSLSQYVEWRFLDEEKKHFALIVSAGAYQGSTHTQENRRSYLAVIKLTETENCITDFVDTKLETALADAQTLADDSTGKPCLFENENTDQKRAEEFASPKDFVGSVSNERTKLIFEANGDLNGDGLKDWAGVFTKRKIDKNFDENTELLLNQLFILTQNKNGKFIVAEKSKEGCAEISVCWVESLEIKNASIYMNVFTKSDAPTSNDFQFKYRNGKFQLIDYKINKAYPAENENGFDKGVEIDRNLITGQVIEKTQFSERKPKIKRSSQKFSELPLKDFEFEYVNKYEFSADEDSEDIEE